ncbi:MAG: Gfo/Idh/MocA family oxidoreductase [Sedimentisphaerales bacterium]|nr:Gfo/Idh/MocA family oxidoreductase [Sedimentisphaerales bacterium]
MIDKQDTTTNRQSGMNRRQFMRSSLHAGLAAGAALKITPVVFGQGGTDDVINVGLIGAGAQGQVLMNAVQKIPNIRFKAICDLWESYNQRVVVRRLNRRPEYENSPVSAYTDYREMLAKEKDQLDAVIVATPDFWHAEHAIACLNAGKHVYCEKEMSNTLESARKMVETAKKTGKLLQIGHQRRSNPRYIHCYDKLIKEANLLNRITTINGQWNRGRAACEEKLVPDRYKIDDAVLKQYGFDSMREFLNWRWFKGKGGGPIVDLGSHQIDIYAWFTGGLPTSVMASGGNDYWKGWDWYDSVMAIYEFDTPQGAVRAFYQTLTTNSSQGYFETFMGDEGTLLISEAAGRGSVYRENGVPEEKWEKWATKGYIKKVEKPEKPQEEKTQDADAVMDVRESPVPPEYEIMATLDKPYHQPHLENFFNAVRGKEKLNCPAQIGYETAVMVLKVNEAVEAGRRLEFKPEDFKV